MDQLKEKVKGIRRKKGWTQEDLARKLEVSLSTVQRWEKQGGQPTRLARRELQRVLREVGSDLPLVRQARKVNENMPHHMVEMVDEALRQINTTIGQAKICVLGLAYKAGVDGRHVLAPKEVANSGITYIGIGRTRDSESSIWDFRKNEGAEAKSRNRRK